MKKHQLVFNAHDMELSKIDDKAQQSTAEASTRRERTQVTLTKPKIFRDRLGSLKDRLCTQFNTESKKK